MDDHVKDLQWIEFALISKLFAEINQLRTECTILRQALYSADEGCRFTHLYDEPAPPPADQAAPTQGEG